MDTYLVSSARSKWGQLVKKAHRNEVPFTLSQRHEPACVAAPHTWFERACRGLNPAPRLEEGFSSFDEQRMRLTVMVRSVIKDGTFISVSRMEETACVLVPIDWYHERVKEIGHPVGDEANEPQDNQSART